MKTIGLILSLGVCAVMAGCGGDAGAGAAIPVTMSFSNVSGSGGTARATTSHDKLYIEGLTVNPVTKTISASSILTALGLKANNTTIQLNLIDGSGAGLSFNAETVYVLAIGDMETIGGQVMFPTTSNGAAALIRTTHGTNYKWNRIHPCLVNGVPYFVHYVGVGDDYLGFEIKDLSGNTQSNAQLSGKFIEF